MIRLGKHNVGPGHPTLVVAEVGVNHNGREDFAVQLIEEIAATGADAVKFQAFVPEALASEVHRRQELRMLKSCALPPKCFERLARHAANCGLTFLCTPFDRHSLELLSTLNCPGIKIGSGELTHTPFLAEAGSMGKPVLLSTGCARLDDIRRALDALHAKGNPPVALLHCVSAYPAPDASLNLRAIPTLASAFPGCPVGYSDHSRGRAAPLLAVALGACVIEKHVTLDPAMDGPDHAASATIDELALLVQDVRRADRMLGDGRKTPAFCEGLIGRSLVAARDLPAGATLTPADVDHKRPGTGIRPFDTERAIGSRLIRNLKRDELLSWEDLEKEAN